MRRIVPFVFAVLGSCAWTCACARAERPSSPPPSAVVFPAEETCAHDPDSHRVVVCTDRVGTITPGDLPEPYALCPMHQEARYGEDYVVATFSVSETELTRRARRGACCYAHCAPAAFE